MSSENTSKKYIKVSTLGAVFFSLLLATTSFYSGQAYLKSKGAVAGDVTAKSTFAATKTDKPNFEFYVMSFCPYGNQIEDVIKPVAELLGDKATIRPRYIFSKIDNLDTYCTSRSGDANQCAEYIKAGYFKDQTECKNTIAKSLETCKNPNSYIKSADNKYYGSLHGRVEANQNIREICAFNMVTDKKVWWNFIQNVNQNCDSVNADSCWQEQATKAGLDTNAISDCFNKQAIELIEKEIAMTDKYQVSGSPTLLVNEVSFPPESAYTSDNMGTLKINKTVFKQTEYRTPDAIKEAVCASFKKAPKECNTKLENPSTNSAPAAGGC